MKLPTPALRACLKKRLSQGYNRDEAEAMCRHAQASRAPGGDFRLKTDTSPVATENNASSAGPGWLSRGSSLGTDRVVKSDPRATAVSWAKNMGRKITGKDKQAWTTAAKGMGVMDPDDQEAGWEHLMADPNIRAEAAEATYQTIEAMRKAGPEDHLALATLKKVFEGVGEWNEPEVEVTPVVESAPPVAAPQPVSEDVTATLKTVFGESVSWSGSWVPLKQMIGGNKREVQPKARPFVDRQPKVTEKIHHADKLQAKVAGETAKELSAKADAKSEKAFGKQAHIDAAMSHKAAASSNARARDMFTSIKDHSSALKHQLALAHHNGQAEFHRARADRVPERAVHERVSVNVVTPQAGEVGNARGQAADAMQDPGGGYGFYSWSANRVYDMALRLIPLYPLKSPEELIGMAIQKSGVLSSELTPEDDQLLKIAVAYAQNGPPKSNVRTGGTPGGPFRSQDDGHTLGIRGTMGLP